MRWVIYALAVFAFAPRAFAADLDILPGPETVAPSLTVGPATFTRWSGFYVGGQFGYSDANADFSGATLPLLLLNGGQPPSQVQVLGTGNDNAIGYGGFVGYNTQWQDAIIGVEVNYTHTDLVTTSSTTGIPFTVLTSVANLTGTANLDLTDYASFRGRAGLVVGNLLPYGFAGVVVGRASYSITSSVNTLSGPPLVCLPPTCSNSAGQSSALLYGFSAGAGVDWALTQNFFLRGEFEFIQFAPIASINVNIIGARVGAGLKF